MIDAKDFITQKGTVNYSLIDDVILKTSNYL